MGILNFFGGSGPDKAQKLKAKATQKYGDPSVRQKALDQLGEMDIPEAILALMGRFTVNVDPQTTDQDEKDLVLHLIQNKGEKAVAPVLEFLRRSDQASSWAIRVLGTLRPETEVVALCASYLEQISSQYTRSPEKKLVLLHFLEGKQDPKIALAATALLEDMADDVKVAAMKVLGPLKHEAAREPILAILTHGETGRRVQAAAIHALTESGFGVQGYREKVEGLLQDPYFVDKSGLVKRRGEATP